MQANGLESNKVQNLTAKLIEKAATLTPAGTQYRTEQPQERQEKSVNGRPTPGNDAAQENLTATKNSQDSK